MTRQFWVRVGTLGHIHPLVAADAIDYPRLTRVLCRTRRGLEVGEILARHESPTGDPEGTLLRALTSADDAHLARLRLQGDAAFRSCRQWMQQFRISAVLLDVEPLFDGQSLHFYFADRVPPRVELLKQQLSTSYQAEVQFHSIQQQTADESCGGGCADGGCCGADPHNTPGDTTARTAGCGKGSCDSCSVAEICGKRKRLVGEVQAAR